ncbi:hypothetical protein PPERSA_09663 [Pseudocohnilembus persalinus]|uniref:DUF676 domain-containing protein n=1 Tax=Pseudocohnilembus persalinus TaxID=266149 RepID=A0A0V0R708_PSEPJ|nr:hypothetical protein PPERSA_09663 [Pseudocohnilembus persalinus]|eukprot:KRX10279.1 hypothetical protein PPERSA_09663 [Pseudocohnilembus persalinus]
MRNIDLFHQGIYQLKAQIYQKLNGKKIFAIPYNVITGETNKKIQHQPSKIFRNAILEDTSFYSKPFSIKYCEEEVQLNDMCLFRADFIDAFPEIYDKELYIQVDLLFIELSMQHSENLFKNGPQDGFKVQSTFQGKLHQIHQGIHEFVPITFDDMHFCCVNMTVHTLLRDFTYKSIPEYHPIEFEQQQQQRNEDSQGQKNMNDQEQNGKNQKFKGKPQNQQQLIFQKGQICAKNFQEFFKYITNGFQRHKINEFYQKYVRFLRLQHERFLIIYQALIEDIIFDKKIALQMKATIQKNYIVPYPGFFENQFQDGNILDDLMINSDFSDFFSLEDEKQREKMCQEIQFEINMVAGYTFQLWYSFIEFFQQNACNISNKLQKDYHDKITKRWNESIFQNQIEIQDLTQYVSKHQGKDHEKEARRIRQQHYYKTLAPLNIEDLSLFPKYEIHPIIFSDIYKKVDKTVPKQLFQSDTQHNSQNEDIDDDDQLEISLQMTDTTSGIKQNLKSFLNVNTCKKTKNQLDLKHSQNHIIVLVHGLQGNNFDMRLLKDHISLKYPDIQILSSSSNEEYTEGDIWEMGQRLGEEVKKFIREWCPNGFGKLSFIGHSLGGLIIRSSIPHLKEFQDKFFTIMTMSTPHLGFLYHSSKMVDAAPQIYKNFVKNQFECVDHYHKKQQWFIPTSYIHGGLWFMKQWKKCPSLNQMTLTDSKQIENTFIYKLAHIGALDNFKNIVLISSHQDSYVPYYSARIQNNPKRDNSESNRSKIYAEILKALTQNIVADKLYRLDVSFEIPQKSLDKMIGRAAHIQFLENTALQKMIVYNFPQFFQ